METEQLLLVPVERRAEPKVSARSSHTDEAYEIDRRRFLRWCADRNRPAHDVGSVAAYLENLACTPPLPPDGKPPRIDPDAKAAQPHAHSFSTIRRRLAGIADYFIAQGLGDPRRSREVRKMLDDIRRDKDRVRMPEHKERADAEYVTRILERMDGQSTLTGGEQLRYLRDRSLILVVFSGAMSREEARVLRVADVTPLPEGMQCVVNRSEFQSRERRPVILKGASEWTCPVTALARYLTAAGIGTGYIFRGILDSGYHDDAPISKAQFSRIYEARVRAAGLDPRRVTPQAFVAGVAFQVGKSGGTLAQALALTGHKDAKNVLGAFLDGKAHADHPGRLLGL